MKLEQYGHIPTQHINFLNDHFDEIIRNFNDRYAIEGGRIGSLQHQMALEKASSYVARQMIQEANNFTNSDLSTMSSSYEFEVDELDLVICVDVETEKCTENQYQNMKNTLDSFGLN